MTIRQLNRSLDRVGAAIDRFWDGNTAWWIIGCLAAINLVTLWQAFGGAK